MSNENAVISIFCSINNDEPSWLHYSVACCKIKWVIVIKSKLDLIPLAEGFWTFSMKHEQENQGFSSSVLLINASSVWPKMVLNFEQHFVLVYWLGLLYASSTVITLS